MNSRLRELMAEAGYAAPELAGRAQRLAELLPKECTGIYEAIDNGNPVKGTTDFQEALWLVLRDKNS